MSSELGPSYSVLHSIDHNTSMHPPYLQRSISAPAIAEHVSDALLPNYEEFDESHIDTGSSFYSELPSRLNPRMPKPMRALHHNDNASGEIGFETNGFFEDGIHQGILTSLIMDAKAMTPVDKIQEDFPSTPSAVYSSRLTKIAEVPNEHDFAEDESNDMISIPLNSSSTPTEIRLRDDHSITSPGGHNMHTIAPSPHIDLSIDQATLSLQNMFVSSFDDSNSLRNQGGVNVGLGFRPMNSNNMNISLNNSHMQGGNQQQQQQQQSLHFMNTNNTQLNGTTINSAMNLNTLPNNTMMANNPLQSLMHANDLPLYLRQQSQLQPQLQLQNQLQPNMGTNNLSQQGQVQYQDPMSQIQQQSPHLIHLPPQQAQQAQYFIQQNSPMMNMNISNQPLYVDSNAQQQVYYRLDPTTGLYQNDNPPLLYSLDGTPIPLLSVNSLMTDPLSQQQQQQLQQGQQPSQVYNPYVTNPSTAYWPNTSMMTNDQSQILMMANNSSLAPLNANNNNTSRENPNTRRVMTQQQQQQLPYPQQQLQGQAMMARGFPNPQQQQLTPQQQQQQFQNMNRVGQMIPGPIGNNNNNLTNNLPMKPSNQIIQNNNNNSNMRNNNGHMMINIPNMQNQMMPTNNSMMNGNGSSNIGYGMDENGLIDLDMQNRMMNNLHQEIDLQRMNDSNGSMMMGGGMSNNNNNSNNQNMNNNGNNNNNRNNNNNNRMDRNDKNHNNRNNNNSNNNNKSNNQNNNNNNNQNNQNNNNNAVPTPVRDSLVEDFRNTYGKSRQWELKDLVGHVVPFCQDQHGSRFIQQRLEVASDADKQIIFDEVMPTAHSLMTDVFGNYVIQKLFEYGAPDQCEALASLLTGHAVGLALQMYGCRVIQKALEYVNTGRLVILVQEFEGTQVLRCVHDQNGNHVIQKCIEVVSRVAKEAPVEVAEYLSSRILFIIQSFQGRVRELSMHPYGCRVVQRILEHCTNSQKACLLEELRLCCIELVQDQYGNYVIQHVMQHGWETDRAILIKEVQEHLLEFSQHKFASNVVEKCLQYSNKKDRDEMIWTIIKVTFDLNNPVDAKTGHCVLENMVRDPYANYVVQKVIDVSDERQRGAIIRYVRENIVQLRRYTYGKHIIVRLEKVSGEKF